MSKNVRVIDFFWTERVPREKKSSVNTDVVIRVTLKVSLIRSCTDLQYERAYCAPAKKWSLLGMRFTSTHKVSCRVTSWYYPCWKHSHRAVAHYTLHEVLYVFSVCSSVTLSLVPMSVQHIHLQPGAPLAAPKTPIHLSPLRGLSHGLRSAIAF